MSIYPAQIDDSTTLPIVTNILTPVSAEVINSLRSAIIAIEQAGGVNPGSVYGTIRARLDFLEALIINGGGGGGGGGSPTGPAGADLGGTYPSPIVLKIHGHAVSSSNPSDGQVLTWSTIDNQWEPKTPSSGFTAGGDLTGSSISQVVSKIGGNPIVISGLQKSDIITYNGTTLINRADTTVNILDFGANGNGVADNTTAFANASTFASTHPSGKIYIPAGTYKLNSNQTITGNLEFAIGAMLLAPPSVTVTLTGTIEANDYQQIFSVTQGSSIIQPTNCEYLSICWYGAKTIASIGDAIYSDRAIQSALDSCTQTPAGAFGQPNTPVRIPGGSFAVSQPFVIGKNNVTIYGDGKLATYVGNRNYIGPVIIVDDAPMPDIIPNDYAGGNSVNLGPDGNPMQIHINRYGDAWHINGKSQFCLEFIFAINGTQAGSNVLLSSSGSDPDVQSTAFVVWMFAADLSYSNSKLGIGWDFTTSSGKVRAQTADLSGTIKTDGTWYNLRLDYDGTNMRIFVDGVAQNIFGQSGTTFPQTGNIVQNKCEGVVLGSWGFLIGFDGFNPIFFTPLGSKLASLRMGWTSRGTSNYSPPVAKFTEDGSTKFLINFDVFSTMGAVFFARGWTNIFGGMFNGWLPSLFSPSQVGNMTIRDFQIEAQAGVGIDSSATPGIAIKNMGILAGSAVVLDNNAYNASLEDCNFGGSNSSGTGIRIGPASNYFIVRNCNIGGFDLSIYCETMGTLEGYNYLIDPGYAGLYLEGAFKFSVDGNCFISDEASGYHAKYGCVVLGCGPVTFNNVLFGLQTFTDQIQLLVQGTPGGFSYSGASKTTCIGCNFNYIPAAVPSVKLRNLNIDSAVEFIESDWPYINPFFSVDSNCLASIIVSPQDKQEKIIALSDVNTSLTVDQWVYGRLKFTGTLTATRTITVPTIANASRWIENDTNHSLIITTGSGTSVTIASNQIARITCPDGTNIILDTSNAITIDGYAVIGSNAKISDIIAFNGSEWVNRENMAINVKDFGAIGDGIADDTAAIQAAIDAQPLYTDAVTWGPKVDVPPGRYLISKPLLINKYGGTFLGAGPYSTRFQAAANYMGPMIIVAPDNAMSLELVPGILGSGQSLRLDPHNVNNGYISLRDCPFANLDGLTSFTLEFFIKIAPTHTGFGNILFSIGSLHSAVPGDTCFQFELSGSSAPFNLQTRMMTSSGDANPGNLISTFNVNQVYHIALTYDGTNVKWWVDGNLDTTVAKSGSILQQFSEDILLGGFSSVYYPEQGDAVTPFDGYMDSLRFSNSVRYTTNFTPPSSKFVSDNHTMLLINFDQTYHQCLVADSWGSLDGIGANATKVYFVSRPPGSQFGVLPFGKVEVGNFGLDSRAHCTAGFINYAPSSYFHDIEVDFCCRGFNFYNNDFIIILKNITLTVDGSSLGNSDRARGDYGFSFIIGGITTMDDCKVTSGACAIIASSSSLNVKKFDWEANQTAQIGIILLSGDESNISGYVSDDEINNTLFQAGVLINGTLITSFYNCSFEMVSGNACPTIWISNGSLDERFNNLRFYGCRFGPAAGSASIFEGLSPQVSEIQVNGCQQYSANSPIPWAGTNAIPTIDGKIARTITTGTSSTCNSWDQTIGINVSTMYNITLPPSSVVFTTILPAGKTIIIKDQSGNADTNNITITASSGQTIDGGTNTVINTARGSKTLTFDGLSDWMVT